MPIDIENIQRVMNEAECLFTPLQVEAALNRMAEAISENLRGTNPIVYTVMNGGLILAGRLLPKLLFPLEVAYLHATRYGHTLDGGHLDWRVRPNQDLRGRHVLVLDDILDEGYTIGAVMEYLLAEGAEAVQCAVLVNKIHNHKARPEMHPNYFGLEAPDRFLFGCGMDYKGYWRNAPGIYALREEGQP